MLRIGCQTYSWQMSIVRYQGKIDHIATVIAQAGFAGMETEIVMLGDFAAPERLAATLDAAGLDLAALTLVEAWAGDSGETSEERSRADSAVALTGAFADALLVLCQAPGEDRRDLRERQQHALRCVGDIAERAGDSGVRTAFHANSPEGSLFRTAEDYDVLLDGLPAAVGFAPDLGHIAKGGMDPLAMVAQHRDRVVHVHAKDMDETGRWVPIGTGVVPVSAVAELLSRTAYEGWLVLEDESELAERDPDAVTLQLGSYVDGVLRPLAQGPPGIPVDGIR
jgi:inosose dehydratase